jgi:CDP-diglyceride synthetase
MAAFGSVIAPFGGFFASGFKRAFGLKVTLFVTNIRLN